MKYLVFTLLLLFIVSGSFAQTDPADHPEQVKSSVARLLAKKRNVHVLLKSLLEVHGRVVSISDNEFGIRFKNKDGRVLRTTVFYRDVLEIDGAGERISQVPAVTKVPHGSWRDVGNVFGGTKVLVMLADGRHIRGFSNSITDTHLVMLDSEAKRRLDIPRDQISAFVGFTLSRGGAKKGALRAANELHRAPILGALGMGIGAIVGALTKVERGAVLIYSR